MTIKASGVKAKELVSRVDRFGQRYVIAKRETTIQPFVVWHVTKEGHCSAGHYCDDLHSAVENLVKRTKCDPSILKTEMQL